jgi:hypothetical protein
VAVALAEGFGPLAHILFLTFLIDIALPNKMSVPRTCTTKLTNPRPPTRARAAKQGTVKKK